MISKEKINLAAEQYAENENSAYTNDMHSFAAGADFAQQHWREEVERLVGDYQQRVDAVSTAGLLSDTYTTGRRHEIRSIIDDLQKLLTAAQTAQNEK